ncbi:Glutathione gamma-glutamylcysteinyltransferase 1 [Turnera subulata]|uniref:Glutathione gamma-glutamylcysteinyltransferase 1 n=1 Tax=Turnera subulata TaxID=218843 RepID=A0A9Q0F0P0_9ROSI|nr:Glutathione gamma-glutamylcysteinyltransferase 1 [Turnera subulata]
MACPRCFLLQIFVFFIFFQSQTCSSEPAEPIALSLKTQKHPTPAKFSTGTNKLLFHHNVTLTVSLTVGSPPQNITMVLDTGSELAWLHCKKMPNLKTFFNPLASTTYTKIPCDSDTCRTKTRELPIPVSCDPAKLCHVLLSYADASSIEGNLASDTFRVVGSVTRPQTVFGCMDSGFTSTNEEDTKTTGIMGLNRGALSFVNQMELPKFSYCISALDSSGILLLGDSNIPWLAPLNYTPLVQISTPLPSFDRAAYTVQLEGIKVNDRALSLPKSILVPDHTGAGQTMVDSGTQFTFLLGPVYTALKNEYMAQTKGVLRVLNEPEFVFQGAMDLCYLVEESSSTHKGLPDNLPVVRLMFQGAEMRVSGERLLVRVPGEVRGKDSVWCFTFGNSDLLGIASYVIGHHHQQNVWVEFDLAKSRIGFAEVRCDLASQRLGLHV